MPQTGDSPLNPVDFEILFKRKQAQVRFDEWANETENLIDSRESIDYDQYYDEDVFYSGDLTEATYSMSFEILEVQDELLDQVMQDIPAWKVFSDLFKIKSRTIDMTEIYRQNHASRDYGEVVTTSGEFMGDPLSFIHLTILWLSIVNQTSIEMQGDKPVRHVYEYTFPRRPYGQQVGDDIILLRVKRKYAEALRRRTDALGLQRSKIDSISRDIATFCEQYLWRAPKGFNLESINDGNRFGDLIFLDSIKGSILTGRSKIKADGAMPFLGHANALNKQLEYTPKDLEWKKDRAKTLLWARNYREAKGITRTLAQWPRIMGGLDLAVGRPPDLDDVRMQNYLPYLYRLFDSNTAPATVLETLVELQSIWRTSNKGFVWDYDEIDVMKVASQLTIVPTQQAISLIPDYLTGKNWSVQGKYLEQNHGLISLMMLGEELNRRFNFLKWWKGDLPSRKMLRLRQKQAYERHVLVWNKIRSELKPCGKPFFISDVKKLAHHLGSFTFGMFFQRDDPAIRDAFDGTPSLYFRV